MLHTTSAGQGKYMLHCGREAKKRADQKIFETITKKIEETEVIEDEAITRKM